MILLHIFFLILFFFLWFVITYPLVQFGMYIIWIKFHMDHEGFCYFHDNDYVVNIHFSLLGGLGHVW